MRKLGLTLLLYLFFTVCGVSQDKTASPELLSWKGNTLDTTTADEVVAKYGRPEKDALSGFEIFTVNQTFSKEAKKKKWRVVRYKTLPAVENVEDIKFAFDATGKLVFLQFEPKQKVGVQAFLKAYQAIKFQPYNMTGISFGLNITAHYSVQGRARGGGHIIALVEYGFGGGRGGTELNKNEQSNDTLAGHVTWVQMISKRLEAADDSEIFN